MKKKSLVIAFVIFLFGIYKIEAQQNDSPKIILITLDGLRWQELFTGADSLLITNKEYVNDTTSLKKDFWRDSPKDRREALLPFFWNEITKTGQIHGNRNLNSKVNLTNNMVFSFPGYNEILTGKADDEHINSNDKINNPNKTVLEILHELPQYKGKIAAFGSWDVFPFIINEERSGIPVNAGFEKAKDENLTERELFLNELQDKIPSPWGSVRLDAFTHYFALEHMKKHHPEVVYIAYGETDDFAHNGNYQAYLRSAHTTDTMIKELWEYTQSDEFYKDNTVFLISTDHGRGTVPLETWKHHGTKIKDADEVWFIAFGKGVKPLGEVSSEEQLYSNQIAPTILDVLNQKINKKAMPGKPVSLQK